MSLPNKYWTDTSTSGTFVGGTTTSGSTSLLNFTTIGCTYCNSCSTWGYCYCKPQTIYINAPPMAQIKLSLDEANHLRTLAANDKKLLEILRKMLPYLEIKMELPA